MRRSSTRIAHLAHPRPVPWSNIFEAFSTALNIPLVPYSEWLARLEKSAEDLATVSAEIEAEAIRHSPALRLIDFFREASVDFGPSTGARGMPSLSLERAKKASQTFGDLNLRQLSSEDVNHWLWYWKSVGFMPQ
jgi:hypothetical protein